MSVENYRVDQYQHQFVNEPFEASSRCVSTLYLYSEDKEMLCAIACVPGKTDFAKPEKSANGFVSIEVGEFQMTSLVDMLRNERPVYFSWLEDTQTVRITTNQEPVGEQELRKLFSFLYI